MKQARDAPHVMPAETGIQGRPVWTPACAGVTGEVAGVMEEAAAATADPAVRVVDPGVTEVEAGTMEGNRQ